MVMATKNDKPKADYHYFGSTVFNWATGATRAEVLAKLGKVTGPNELKLQVKHNGGLSVYTVRVNAPQDTDYQINGYAPQGVETTAPIEYRLVNTKGHVVPVD